jgi:hypothetical protein
MDEALLPFCCQNTLNTLILIFNYYEAGFLIIMKAPFEVFITVLEFRPPEKFMSAKFFRRSKLC